ncbi:amino acid adenylation domain-containing protein [Streptomyces sp. NPDC008159]|uniref:amino acid adenylation domain-containing protein n=1 Tax=Streptomyces sp. NPDC008159 TaxID=3364817 RepID=UPI0036E6E477
MTTSLQTDVLADRPAPTASTPRPDETRALGTGTPLPHDGRTPVHELVAGFARITPTAPAVSGRDGTIDYRALDAWAGRVAARLTESGVGRGSRVAVLVEPSTAMVAAVLGVLKAEAAYVPVDLAHPDRRIAGVLADARVGAAVVTGSAAGRLSGLGLPLVRVEDTAGPTGERGTARTTGAGEDAEDGDEEPATGAAPPSDATGATLANATVPVCAEATASGGASDVGGAHEYAVDTAHAYAVEVAADGPAARGEAGRATAAVGATGRPDATVVTGVTGAVGDDPAYLIYTSGSTGEPKGVEVGHRQLAASTLARRMVYPGRPVFLLVSPLAFDSSVAGLWGTLTAGGHLVVAAPDEVRDPERLMDLVERHGVTGLLCVPSLYAVLLDAAERAGMARLRSLETVTTAGEPLPADLMRRHFALHARTVALVNEYGPTEATVWASYRRYDAPGPVTVGGPAPGVRLYVLDERMRPVPRGTEGELFIGGAGVAHGYFGRPEATAKVFLDDPFAAVPGARMYRTGDLVRWTEEGTLDFLGRRDHQVKIRGHRIELGAVEAALCELPGVREAVVVPDTRGTALTGFVLAPARPDARSLREQMAGSLPAPMVPARIEVLDSFPRTVNGKADRARLRARAEEPYRAVEGPYRANEEATPEQADAKGRPVPDDGPTAGTPGCGTGVTVPADGPAAGAPDGGTPPRAPGGGDPSAGVAAAWAEVLKVTDVPGDVNFFDLGGHSLAMFQLQDALERHTGTRPPIVALFRHTTVSAQVALIRDGGADAGDAEADARRSAARRARALRARRHRAQEEPTK